MGCLEWPDACSQPVQQGKIISDSSEESLTEMNVRLNKAWHDPAAPEIAHKGISDGQLPTHLCDEAILDSKVPVNDTARVSRKEDSISQQCVQVELPQKYNHWEALWRASDEQGKDSHCAATTPRTLDAHHSLCILPPWPRGAST